MVEGGGRALAGQNPVSRTFFRWPTSVAWLRAMEQHTGRDNCAPRACFFLKKNSLVSSTTIKLWPRRRHRDGPVQIQAQCQQMGMWAAPRPRVGKQNAGFAAVSAAPANHVPTHPPVPPTSTPPWSDVPSHGAMSHYVYIYMLSDSTWHISTYKYLQKQSRYWLCRTSRR